MSTVTTPRGFKLGKLDPVRSPFQEFKTYFAEALPAPPTSAHWGRLVRAPWGMLGNGPDPSVTIAPPGWGGAGDCVEAGKAHALLTANYDEAGRIVIPSSNEVIEQYCVAQNCTPDQLFSDPSQYDNGEDITTSLTTWCTTEEYGVKLGFTAPVSIGSEDDIKNAIYLGGGLDIGIQLPQSAEEQFPNEWTWQPASPTLGGHDVWLTGYTEDYVSLVTWGQLIRCTWQFLKNAMDEAHVVVMPQAITAGKGPTGLAIAQWESELAELKAA
jgi:hypothetical protein